MRCTCGQENPVSATQCPRCQKALLFGADPVRMLIDVGTAAGLVLVLGLVFLFDRGTASSEQQGPGTGENLTLFFNTCPASRGGCFLT